MISDYSKQMELVKPHEFNERINVIGVGALGSWITFFLLKMGFNDIHVYDFDKIEEHNIPNQLFRENQIDQYKVDSMEEIYMTFFHDNKKRLFIHNEKLTDCSLPLKGVVFCAVDSMKSRKELYEYMFKYNSLTKLWIEGRLSLYGAYVYTLTEKFGEQTEQYEKTLYDDAETEVSACGVSQTALPAGVNAASIMIMQMIEWHNNRELLNKIEYSIPWCVSMTKSWNAE